MKPRCPDFHLLVMSSDLNINCGVLGHVDSGKTSLCRALSSIKSTASLDKHPQSQERGITIDLGFSSFDLLCGVGFPRTIVTLIDCPGHASLIRAVLGAAAIIDLCLLVIDIRKGFQAQSIECLTVAEIVTRNLVVVVNKADMISEDQLADFERNFRAKARDAMMKTRFGPDVPLCFVSAFTRDGLDNLTELIRKIAVCSPPRKPEGLLHIAYDHCFQVKGQGAVVTGTVVSGSVCRGDKLYFPDSGEIRDVRSIQIFRRPTEKAQQGDRIGISVPGLSTNNKERGDIFGYGDSSLSRANVAVFMVRKARYFKETLANSCLQVTLGHQHAMAKMFFFEPILSVNTSLDSKRTISEPGSSVGTIGKGLLLDDLDLDWRIAQDSLNGPQKRFKLIESIDERDLVAESALCLIMFDRKLTFFPMCAIIATRIDMFPGKCGSRIALYGRHLTADIDWLCRAIIKEKRKSGEIVRKLDDSTYLVKGLLKKEGGDLSQLIGKDIIHDGTQMKGTIESTFGKSGLLRTRFLEPIVAKLSDSVTLVVQKSAIQKAIESHQHLSQ
jgi:selenocysteine-specific elongation factor